MNFLQRMKLRRKTKQYIKRPLDIQEILSRDSEANVVVDAYEFLMRKYHWSVEACHSAQISIFLLCVLYGGEVANGGILQFLANSSGDYAHQTADALHIIGALDAEKQLRRSFDLFDGGTVPEDRAARNKVLDELGETNTTAELDAEAYREEIYSLCYLYLLNNKDCFLAEA